MKSYNEMLKQYEELKESTNCFDMSRMEETVKYNLVKRVEYYNIGCLHVRVDYLNGEYIVTFKDDKSREYKTCYILLFCICTMNMVDIIDEK